MPPQTAHLAGIGEVPIDRLKTVLARLVPAWAPSPSQKAERERLRDEHPDFI